MLARAAPAAGTALHGTLQRCLLLVAAAVALAVTPGLARPDSASAAAGLPITVDDTRDASDWNPGDGICRGGFGGGGCTLRAAVQEANASIGPDTINVEPGIYELEIPTLNDDTDQTGDYDVHGPTTFVGEGTAASIVDGGFPREASDGRRGLDRLLEIHPTAGNVTIKDLTLREGYSDADGGAIQNWSSGLLRLERVHVKDNLASGAGGGVENGDPGAYEWPVPDPSQEFLPGGRIEAIASTFTGNASGSGGAAINNSSDGTVSIVGNSRITDNPGRIVPDPQDPEKMIPAPGVYEPDTSAIANEGQFDGVGTIRIADSEVSRNYAEQPGGGIVNLGDGFIVVERSKVRDNTSEADGGGIYTVGGTLSVTGGSVISGNEAHSGGGIYSDGATTAIGLRSRVTIADSAIEENTATAGAGGVFNGGDAHLAITDTTVSRNTAADAGAGLSNEGRASLALTRVTFTENETNDEGGGAYVAGGRLAVIEDSDFVANKAGVPEVDDSLPPGTPPDPAANIAGGGGLYTENGPINIDGSRFVANTASDEGGAVSIDNFGDVTFSDSLVKDNRAGTDGGGIENSGARVTFDRLDVVDNRAVLDGGGIYNSSSGEFHLLDTTMRRNSAQDGGGLANLPDASMIVRGSLFLGNTARHPGYDEAGVIQDGGHGGGLFSMADGNSFIENATFSGNSAYTGGGGLFHDADGELKLSNSTIWRNSAPIGGGLGVVESDFVPEVPAKPNISVILRNTIVGGSLAGGSCDWYVTSEGGNLDGGGKRSISTPVEGGSFTAALPNATNCFISVPGNTDSDVTPLRDRRGDAKLDAIADNGGPTLTHRANWGSLAIDGGVSPCPETDARGTRRPQNGRCDTGAFEFEGPPPPDDDSPPDTEYISGPIQDTLETSAYRFTGSDDQTPEAELQYECKLVEIELTEAPEPLPPWEPVPPEEQWRSCSSPWQSELTEEGLFEFQVRAIDRADNTDPTPAMRVFGGDTSPPQTIIDEKPDATSNSRAATFTFSGEDNMTPPQFFEYECRLDSRDPELWQECFNPAMYSNLTTGTHTMEVRAYDGAENMDPTPARYTWTVGQPSNCDTANISLTASADAWVDQVNPAENFLFEQQLTVRSGSRGDPIAVPPEPLVGENARALVKFDVPDDARDCELESATLRLHTDSGTAGRTLEARPLTGPFKESTVTWGNQPGARAGAGARTASADTGYRDWDVTSDVRAIMESGAANHGWSIRDAHENDPEGGDQEFSSREEPQDPPEQTLPLLVLKYEADPGPPPTPPTLPPGTQPTEVHCGQVLRRSTLVGNDLIDCPGEGLVVGAPNIVVDLGGHTIDGPDYLLGNVSGQEEGFPAAIRTSGQSNVVIRNGTVQQFGYGVLLTSGTTHSTVEDLTVLRNAMSGVELFDADDGRNGNTIRRNTIRDNELGVTLLSGSENSRVLDNLIGGNLGEAVLIQFSDGHRIEGNTIHGIPLDPNLDSDGGVLLEGSGDNALLDNEIRDTGDAGVVITQGSNGNRVQDALMYRNGDAGVVIQDSDRNQVIDILAHQESDGGVVINNGNDTVVRGSDLRFNPTGVEASSSNDLLVEDNDASDSLQSGFEIGNGVNIRILGNVAHRTGGAGISMEGAAFDTAGLPVGGALIAGNATNENRENGISVADGGHTIRDNDANNNAGFGVAAGENPDLPGQPFPGTNRDGGGNKAAGNAEPEQCTGVVCDTDGPPPPLTALEDVEEPVATILTKPSSPTGDTSATFTFTATDNRTPATAMVFECRIDPGPDPPPEVEEPEPPEPPEPGQPPDTVEPVDGPGWGECISPVTYHGLEQGDHHFEVRALDQADNRDLTPATHDWTVDISVEEEGAGPDAVAPDTRISASPAATTLSRSAGFGFAGSDNATPGLSLSFECSLDGAPWRACTTPGDYADMSLGAHNFRVRAIDLAGNHDPSPASHSWQVVAPPTDTTPPDTTIESGPDPTTVQQRAEFEFSSDEPGVTFECSVNQPGLSGWQECVSPKEYTGVAVGARELRVRARDTAGNVDPEPAGYSWLVGAAPVPGHVYCGQVITRSIVVRNDLVDCLWDGLVVGAPNITIDLDGHTIDGKGVGAAVRNDGHDSVTIRNGTVTDYDFGVMLNPGTAKNIVEGMTLDHNQEAGIALGKVPHPTDPNHAFPQDPPSSFQSGVTGNAIRNNTILANDVGVWLTNSADQNVIRNNTLAASGSEGIWIERSDATLVEHNDISMSSGAAVLLQGSSDNTVLDNQLAENNGGVSIDITRAGTVGLESNHNRVEKNTITEAGGHALEVQESRGNQLLDNEAHFANGDGVSLYRARETAVIGNDVRKNKGGIALKSSSGNRLEGNDASDSEGTGIELEALSINNVIKQNVSSNNDGDGMYIGDETSGGSGMWIEGNVTANNKGYGIYVPKVSHTLKANIANDNGGWGIYASEGSNGRVNIDGGGNKGQGNLGPLDPITLKPLQCFSIRCDGGAAPNTDAIAPSTELIETPPDPSTGGLEVFRFIGSDNASTVSFQCSIDGGAWDPCTSPLELRLPVGTRRLAVRAVDLAGNVDLTPATYGWWIDPPPVGVPPEAIIESGPDPTTVRTEAKFELSASERGSTLACSLDGAAFTACASPKSYSGLAVGEHSMRLRATDAEGNSDVATWSWVIKPPPVATEVSCGEILVRSTKVLNDLVDCPGHALIVGTGGITVDLNGHTLDGTGLDAGILNHGFDSVTVTNGTVHEFDYGIQLNPGSGSNIVSSIRAENNQEGGIALADADQQGTGNTIRDNVVTGNGYGIALLSGTRNALVHDNALGSNSQDGVLVEHATAARIESNEITLSGGAGVQTIAGGDHHLTDNTLSQNGAGIALGEELLPTNNARIERNTIVEGAGGITVSDSHSASILFNSVRDANGAGVVLDMGGNNLVRGNDLQGNKGGIEVSESSGNRLEANNASGTLGTGIELGSLSFDNVVLRNTVSTNAGEGIAVSDAPPFGMYNTLEANTADGNGGDGIAIDAHGHVVEDNSAQVNGGWGIYAASGAIDRGGNYAAGNVEPDQCYNVACSSGDVPGSPETWLVDKPPAVSNSRNASFTYNGEDAVTPIHELVFECRLDSTNALAWEDCEYPHDLLNLSPGSHTLEVRAVDLNGAGLADPTPAKHTWTYEPLPPDDAPETEIDVKPDAETWLLDSIFTFHANEPDVTFECKVDSFGYEPCGFEGAAYMSRGGFEWGLEETEVGPHTFSVRAIDFEGNVGVPTTYTWRLLGVATVFTDGPGFTPPETPFEPATGGPTNSPNARIEFRSNVGDATFECSLDLEPFTPCRSPVSYSGLAAGDHLLRVIATDANGVEELEPAEYEWEVVDPQDTAPPETSIERAPASNSSSTTFEFAGTDDLTPTELITYECRLDSTNALDWEECTSPYNLLDRYTYDMPQLAPGEHVFEVRAIDAADPEVVDPSNPSFEGNVDPTPARHTWTMAADTTPPGTGITSGPPATIGEDAPVDFEFFGSDNATPQADLSFECSVDGAAYEACRSPESASGLPPGEHTMRIRAVDLALNSDPTPATRTWTVVPAPVTTISSGPAGRVVDGGPFSPPGSSESAIFVFASDQPGSTYECALDGASFAPCTSPRAHWVVESGTHEFRVRATNAEGVVEEQPATYEWNVELGPDRTGPNTTITSGPRAVDSNSVATFEFRGSDNRTRPEDLTFECALDGSAYSSCTSPDQWSDLTRRTHTLLVRARDAAGNFDLTPARYEWTVELPPVTTILTGPPDTTGSTAATFTFAADVPGSTYQCWLDGVLEPCTSPKAYTGLEHGEHLFAVLARGPGGTSEEQWAEYEWTIGHTEAPVTVIESGPDVETEDRRATFEFSADQPGVNFSCTVDGGEPTPCTSPYTVPRAGLGEHSFEVSATHPLRLDPFGEPLELLYEPIVASWRWTLVDTIAPETVVRYGPPATTSSRNAHFGFGASEPAATIQCSLDFEGYGDCDSPHAIEDLEPGQHVLHVRAVDEAGNADTTPEAYRWTVAHPGPNTRVGSNVTVALPMPNPPGGNATVSFFDVSLAGVTTLDALQGGPPLPPGYTSAGARYYDISTTAEYGEPTRLCVPYDPAAISSARLLQWDGSTFVDVTLTNNPGTGVVCAEEMDLSTIFAVADGSGTAPVVSILSGPPAVSDRNRATFEFVVDQPDAQVQCSLDGLPFTACSSPVSYSQLEAGGHDFRVQAFGPFGMVSPIPPVPYEWEVALGPDTDPPDTRIAKGPPDLTANHEVGFEFTGTDDQTQALDLEFECLLDGELLGSCSSVVGVAGAPGDPYMVEVLAPGRHEFTVRAIDEAGNVDPTPATRSWTVTDLSAPDTSIELGPDSETDATTAVFEFTGEEELTGAPVSEFQCSLDGADFTDCSSPHSIEGLAVGAHNLQVRAVDSSGVVDITPDVYEWLVVGAPDSSPPDTFIVNAPPPTSGPDVIFGFQSSEPAEEFECALDGGQFEACEATLELVGLGSGDHTLEVRALDLAESPNVDPTPARYTWTVVGAPQTTILTHPSALSGSPSAAFTFTSDQPDVTFRCSTDGSPFVECTSPHIAGPLAQDGHTFEVYAENRFRYLDGEPVADLTPASFEWEVRDVTPPETEIKTVTALGPDDLVEPNSLRFELAGTDNGTAAFELEFECSLDGGPFEGCESPYHYVALEGLAGGSHTLRIRAVDAFENADPSPATHTFTTEGAPETTVHSGPAGETDATEATFTFSADRAGATFECSLDLGPFAPCTSGQTFRDVPHGLHELHVRARGPGGAVDQTPAEYAWETGDMSPPVVTIDSGPAAATVDTNATFAFRVDDPAATLQCSLDGAPLTFCSSPLTYTEAQLAAATGDPAGPHTLEVTATKPHLLAETVPAVWEWTVEDQTPPRTTIDTTPPDEVGLGTPADFTFSSNEPGSTFECALDPGALPQFTDCAGPPDNAAQFDGLAAGRHTLLVRAVDPSLNPDGSAESFSWTVVGPPAATIAGSVPRDPAETPDTSATFEFSADQPGVTFACALDGADLAPCSSPRTVEGLDFGRHTFEVQATNRFGLAEEPPASYTWNVGLPPDAVAPETTIDEAPLDTTAESSARFAFHADVPGSTFRCSLDAEAFRACSSPETYTDLAEGPHTLQIRATSPQGYPEPEPARHEWTVDPAPGTTIDSGPDNPTQSTTAVFNFSSDDPAADFECALDEATFGSCPHSVEFANLAPGSHHLQVRAVDPAGNPDPTPVSYRWTIGALPDTTILSAPESPTESSSATFTFSSSPPDATFECALDDAAENLFFQPCSSGVTYDDLGLGDHVLLVRARDAAGNVDPIPAEYEWEIGGVPPTVTLAASPDVTTESRQARFEFSAPGDRRFECALDSGDFSPCASPRTYSGVPIGPHEFRVRVLSPNAIAEPPVTTHAWTVIESTPPQTTITDGPPAVSGTDSGGEGPVAFAFTSDDAQATFECAVDDEAFAGCESPERLSGLTVGDHIFRVRAVDSAGNADPTPATYPFSIAPAPETTIDAGPEGDLNGSTATFDFSATETGSTFECSLDLGPYAACPSPHRITALTDGEHTLMVRAKSALGIVDATPEEWTWGVSAGAPDTAVVSGPAASTTSQSAIFTFSSTEGEATYRCSLDGAPFTDCEAPSDLVHHLIEGVTLGQHTLRVMAVDADGFFDATPASYTWTVVAPPQTTIDSGPADPTYSTTATIGFSADRPGATFECALDGAEYAPCRSPITYEDLPLGWHSIAVRATDQAGHTDATPAGYSWTVRPPRETEPPVTTIDSAPAARTASTSARFRFSASELGVTYECSLDGADFDTCTSGLSFSDLALGDHSFRVRATDAAGNLEVAPASHAWTIVADDVTPPETTITLAPPATSTSISAAFAFEATEPGASFACSLNGAAFLPCGATLELTDLPVGDNALMVRAIDAAGNVDPTPARYEWIVDDTAPETVIETRVDERTRSTEAAFSIESSDQGASFECSLDAAEFTACESPLGLTELAEGSHRLRVRALDTAGNRDASPALHEWTVDTSAPDTAIETRVDRSTTSTEASFNLEANESGTQFECSLDAADFEPCESPRELTEVAAGAHELRVRAIDGAGNVDDSPASFEWTVEPAAVDTTIESHPDATTTSTSATFDFSSQPSGSTFECSLDGEDFAACSSPREYTGLTVGSHELRVRTLDPSGAVDESPARYSWIVRAAPSCGGEPRFAEPLADSWYSQGDPSATHGEDSLLAVTSHGGDRARAQVRFANPAVPEGCGVLSAKLRLYASSFTPDRTLEVLRAGGAWTELGLDWDNRPAPTGVAAEAPSASSAGYVEWDVTEQVRAMYDSDRNHGFIVRDATEAARTAQRQGFESRETDSGHPPQLEIRFGG